MIDKHPAPAFIDRPQAFTPVQPHLTMDFIAKNIAEVAPSMTLSITAQAKALKKQGVDVLSFGAGEPPPPSSPPPWRP
jgi:hypothetical protein